MRKKAKKAEGARLRLAMFDAILIDELCNPTRETPTAKAQVDAELEWLKRAPLRGLAARLVQLRGTQEAYNALPPDARTPTAVRNLMRKALTDCLMMLTLVFRDQHGRLMRPTLLIEAASALDDVSAGRKNALIVSGNEASDLACKYLPAHHRWVRSEAASIIELLISKGEMEEFAAARIVADALSKGGYCMPGATKLGKAIRADTIKRWPKRERSRGSASTCYEVKMELLSMCVASPEEAIAVAKDALDKLAAYCKRFALAN